MTSSSPPKKRKLDTENLSGDSQIAISLSDLNASQVGPVLASFPAARPSKQTTFQCYRIPTRDEDPSAFDFASSSLLVAGESSTVEFQSTPESQLNASGSRYLVGVFNKKTNRVSFRQAPLHVLTCQVKALKKTDSIPVADTQRNEARNRLGEAFGTKKAIKAIRAAERNKVDVSAMESMQDILQETIQANTDALPSKEEAIIAADDSRLIPRHNSSAQSPEGVYSVNDIIPEVEYKAIQISQIMAASSPGERIALLPYKRSYWVNQHLNLVISSAKPSKKSLKILYYISAMFAFRTATFKLDDKEVLYGRLLGVPTVIVDGLLAKFTETPRGSSKAHFTSQNATALLTHMFALCLHIDNFHTDTTLVAKDLSMPVTKVNSLFKTLGCKLQALTDADLRKLGLPGTAASTKRAVLKVPLVFPRPSRRRN